MASIRVEDEARKDPRFVVLGKRMGTSKFDARGRMEELWAYCTEHKTYYMQPELIDACAEYENFSKLICSQEIGLGEETDKGIRIKGTRGRIEWLSKLRNNGKKGGRPKKTKPKPEGNQTETRIEPPSNPLAPVPALVLSPVLTDLKNKELKASPQSVAPSSPIAYFVSKYVEAYEARYKNRPPTHGKVIGQIKTLLRDYPADRAVNLFQVYLQMDDPWFVTKEHDFTTFMENLTKVGNALASGKPTNRPRGIADLLGEGDGATP